MIFTTNRQLASKRKSRHDGGPPGLVARLLSATLSRLPLNRGLTLEGRHRRPRTVAVAGPAFDVRIDPAEDFDRPDLFRDRGREIREGPVFGRVDCHGCLLPEWLSPEFVCLIVARGSGRRGALLEKRNKPWTFDTYSEAAAAFKRSDISARAVATAVHPRVTPVIPPSITMSCPLTKPEASPAR